MSTKVYEKICARSPQPLAPTTFVIVTVKHVRTLPSFVCERSALLLRPLSQRTKTRPGDLRNLGLYLIVAMQEKRGSIGNETEDFEPKSATPRWSIAPYA